MKKLLSVLFILGIFAISALPQTPYTSTKQLITSANLRFKCAFEAPSHPLASQPGRPLTGRVETKPDGTKEFHLISGHYYLMEYAPPPCIDGQKSPAPSYRDLGAPYGAYNGFAWQSQYGNVGDMQFAGLFVDQKVTPEKLYTISSTYYNNTYTQSENNLVLSFRNTLGTYTPYGMYRTSPLDPFSTRMGSGMTQIPDDWTQAVYGERRLGFGFGGAYWQGIIGNHISVGPAFFTLRPQDGTAPHMGYISGPFSPVLYHGYNNNAYNVPRIARRLPNTSYLNRGDYDTWQRQADGTTYWSSSDSNAAGAWLDYPDLNLHGLVTIATHFEGDAQGKIVSAAPTPGTNGLTWDIVFTPDHGTFQKGESVYVPSVDAPNYGGFEGYVSAVNGNTVTIYNIGNGWQVNTWRPTIGADIAAKMWYGPGGPKLPLSRTWLHVYDPVKLAQVASNPSGPWSELDAASETEINLGRFRVQVPLPGNSPVHATAIVANPLNHDVYVMVDNGYRPEADNANIPLVFVYEVIGGTPVPVPVPTPSPTPSPTPTPTPVPQPPPPPVDICIVTPLKVVVSKWPSGPSGSKSATWNSGTFTLAEAEFKWTPLRFVATDNRGCVTTVIR